ncbi:MAG TPA: hypothetical protein VEK78_15855, partial [Gemmatimonadales bacterium]|nr:hypothetical protein [Gemmatimonadales bacterium]
MILAALCTMGVSVADLLQPWPLKIILDHGILGKPLHLPRFLNFLQGVATADTVTLVVAAACGIVVIALFQG